MFFHDADSVEREFGPHGLVEFFEINEPALRGDSLPFINVVCNKI